MFAQYVVLIFALLLGGCGTGSFRYEGDGTFVDNGFKDSENRYVLNLGELKLTESGSHTYTIGKLPVDDALIGSVKFVVGIKLQMSPEDIDILQSKTIDPSLSLELTDANRRVLITGEQSFLDSWTWTVAPMNVAKFTGQATAFVYKDDDNSTYFKPSKNENYELKLRIYRPDKSGLKYTAYLLAKSGGWK